MLEAAKNSGPGPTLSQVVALITDSDWREAVAVMRALRPTLVTEEFVARRPQLLSDGYNLLGVRVAEQVVSLASYTISPHVTLGRELLIHDMATLPDFRGQGHASALISELVRIAAQSGCGRLFVHTRNAQKLYTRSGFQEYSSGMIRRLDR